MKKLGKFLSIFLCLVVFASCLTLLSACGEPKDQSGPTKILFLGDSIMEGILGPSPISERDFYGAYGVIGKRNAYICRNRAVSGHKTAQMLEFVQRDDEGAEMTRTHIKQADIISVSILGNDLLQNDLGFLMVQAAQDDYTAANAHMAAAALEFAEIIGTIKGYNPTATLLVQTLYNPASPECLTITDARKAELLELGVHPDGYRGLATNILNILNNVIYDYLEANPNAYYIVDVSTAFDTIYNADHARGNSLFYNDWVHPSNHGAAVIADTIQKKLEDLGLANKEDAVIRYKLLRYEQMLRLFPKGIDYTAAASEIGKANSCEEITEIYFRLTSGLTPIYTKEVGA